MDRHRGDGPATGNKKITITSTTERNLQKRAVRFYFFLLASVFSGIAYAITPGAGTILRDLLDPITQPPAASPSLDLVAPAITEGTSGGTEITVQTISFTGNTEYTDAALSALLADAIGKTYDLAALQGLTNRITMHYRSHGAAFSRALLPAQLMTDGALVIKIIEGRYGSIIATGNDKHRARAQVFLSKLQTGEVIQSDSLERAALILEDQPGFKVTHLLRPGQEMGTGDLVMNVERDKRYSGTQGLDNHGSRYTGRWSGSLDLKIYSPFLFGDQLQLNTLYSEEDLWVGALNYSLPLGGSGLRANASYTHVNYQLGKEFDSAKLHGTSKIGSIGLSYPIIRSQQTNLSVTGTYQHKVLINEDDITPSSNTNSSDSLPISFNFDHRDQLSGITYGAVRWTPGNFTIATANRVIDSSTAKTAGAFNKFKLELVRQQTLPANFTLFGRVSAQLATNNLDSSEKFGLGGVHGVRAYPSGEAYGDEGVLVQLEMRYTINSFNPYVFYDAGTLSINHTTFSAGTNKRSLAGVGLGIRYNMPRWSVDASAARRTIGTFSDENQADTPAVWVSVKYNF